MTGALILVVNNPWTQRLWLYWFV